MENAKSNFQSRYALYVKSVFLVAISKGSSLNFCYEEFIHGDCNTEATKMSMDRNAQLLRNYLSHGSIRRSKVIYQLMQTSRGRRKRSFSDAVISLRIELIKLRLPSNDQLTYNGVSKSRKQHTYNSELQFL